MIALYEAIELFVQENPQPKPTDPPSKSDATGPALPGDITSPLR